MTTDLSAKAYGEGGFFRFTLKFQSDIINRLRRVEVRQVYLTKVPLHPVHPNVAKVEDAVDPRRQG